jgi:small subunit ribosomal protein S8
MPAQDPIADMLTRIRNAVRNREPQVTILRNRVCLGIATVLKEEGYILGFDQIEDGRQGLIRLDLKYGPRGEQVIHQIKRISKPSCRVYRKVQELPRVLDGLGIAIVSTSRGIVSDRRARQDKIGGELLCTVE